MSLHALALECKAEGALAEGGVAAGHAADVELDLRLAEEGHAGEVIKVVHVEPARAEEEREVSGGGLSKRGGGDEEWRRKTGRVEEENRQFGRFRVMERRSNNGSARTLGASARVAASRA